MTSREHDAYFEDLAPYVLGALPPLEAEALEKHLRGCGECQRELAELRTGAEALARSVERVAPPPTLRERVLEEATGDAPEAVLGETPDRVGEASGADRSGGERGLRGALSRRRARARGRGRDERSGAGLGGLRPVLAGLAVALVAGTAGWALGTAQTDRSVSRTVAAEVDRNRLPGVRGRLETGGRGESAMLRLSGLRNLGADGTYELWIERDGEITPGPMFNPTAEGAAVTGVPGDLAGADAVHVTRERAGGARAPSEKPVISVPLSAS